MQFFIGVISVTVAERTFGKVVAAEYVVVHSDAVGSSMQFFIGVISVAVAVRTFGKVVVAP